MNILFDLIYPADRLISHFQDGPPIKDYVEEFLEFIHQVTWNDDTLKAAVGECFFSLTFGEVDEETTTTQPQSPLSTSGKMWHQMHSGISLFP